MSRWEGPLTADSAWLVERYSAAFDRLDTAMARVGVYLAESLADAAHDRAIWEWLVQRLTLTLIGLERERQAEYDRIIEWGKSREPAGQ